ncbi:MAG: RpiB/LacA/LacB family sugar-phosphate isomerase [Patescibacteria group bacterium]
MKVYLGADHRGFKLKEELKTWLLENDIAGEDLGADKLNPNDDYPIFAEKVARSVSADLEKNLKSRGIVMCGSGVGVDIVANKFHHVRSGLAISPKQIEEAREDDDINILSIPADFMSEKEAKKIVKIFLETPFSEEAKKIRRLGEIEKIEDGL